jgi:hypothetical protein
MKFTQSKSHLPVRSMMSAILVFGMLRIASGEKPPGLEAALFGYRWNYPCKNGPIHFLPDGSVLDSKDKLRYNWSLDEDGTVHMVAIGPGRPRARIEAWFWPDLTGFTYHDSNGNKTSIVSRLEAITPDGVAEKGGGEKKASPAPAPPPPPAALLNPITALSPFILKLDGLLAVHRPDKSAQTFAAEASGRLLILRQEFAANREQAPDEKKRVFDAAIKTSDLIGAALEDRGRALGDLEASQAVKNDGKLNAPSKKDNLAQGIHGGDLTRAIGTIVERRREKQFIAKGEAETAANDHALSAMTVNQWNKRAAQWRDQIAAAFSQIK